MALSKSFARPLATSTETKALSITGAVAEVAGNLHVDVNLTVTTDASATVVKTLFRLVIPITILPANANTPATVNIDSLIYAFNSASTAYSSGGTTPPLSQGTLGVKAIDIDSFLTGSGDARD